MGLGLHHKEGGMHACSFCFILANFPHDGAVPFTQLLKLSLEALKSGLVGVGGICSKEGQSWEAFPG